MLDGDRRAGSKTETKLNENKTALLRNTFRGDVQNAAWTVETMQYEIRTIEYKSAWRACRNARLFGATSTKAHSCLFWWTCVWNTEMKRNKTKEATIRDISRGEVDKVARFLNKKQWENACPYEAIPHVMSAEAWYCSVQLPCKEVYDHVSKSARTRRKRGKRKRNLNRKRLETKSPIVRDMA